MKINNNSIKKLKGKRKETNKDFINICKYEKGELKSYLKKELSKYYKEVISKDGFLYVRGNEIVLTAHLDTTPSVEYGKRKMVKDVYEYKENGKTYVYSTQGIGGDDRCGVYMIMEILKRTELRPTIVFCEDEEIGCIGSEKFTETKYIKELMDKYFIIELDRRGSDDIVFYDDENEYFHKYVADVTGYVENYGSCSDISYLCPSCGISGVNISCGYYNEHHDYETVCYEEMERTLNTTIKLIKEGLENGLSYEYVEKVYYRNSYNDWYKELEKYEYKNNDWYGGLDRYEYKNNDFKYYLYVAFDNGFGDCGEENLEAESIAELWYDFFSSHPNITMADVMDFQEYSDADLFSKVN